jgi:hypothetical protein
MSRKSLLVLSILLLSAAAFAGTQSSNSQAGDPVLVASNSVASAPSQDVQNFQLRQPQSFEIGADDDICYRIRAYIFKRDDDHAPVFVRSTTCGPSKPHTKDAKWPDAKLVPAK